jgi:cell division protein FtsX
VENGTAKGTEKSSPLPLDYQQRPQRQGPTLFDRLAYILSGIVIGTLGGLLMSGLGRVVVEWVSDLIYNGNQSPERQLNVSIAVGILTGVCLLIGWVAGAIVGNWWARVRSRPNTRKG